MYTKIHKVYLHTVRSTFDLAFTRQLIDLGQLAGIPVRDHLVLGAADSPDGFISIRATTDIDFTEQMQ